MNSFRLTAVGELARNPELSIKGDITFARFCLVGNDEVAEGERDGPREVVTSLWFLAFGEIATTIARCSRKRDQLILEARVIANQWTDKQGERQHGHTFIVTGFRFGARRGEDGSPIAVRPGAPDKPLIDAAEAGMEVAD
jgi:single-stranded DNA-binding protein